MEAFIKVIELSVSILEADSVHLCHFQLCFSIDRIRLILGLRNKLVITVSVEVPIVIFGSVVLYTTTVLTGS